MDECDRYVVWFGLKNDTFEYWANIGVLSSVANYQQLWYHTHAVTKVYHQD